MTVVKQFKKPDNNNDGVFMRNSLAHMFIYIQYLVVRFVGLYFTQKQRQRVKYN